MIETKSKLFFLLDKDQNRNSPILQGGRLTQKKNQRSRLGNLTKKLNCKKEINICLYIGLDRQRRSPSLVGVGHDPQKKLKV